MHQSKTSVERRRTVENPHLVCGQLACDITAGWLVRLHGGQIPLHYTWWKHALHMSGLTSSFTTLWSCSMNFRFNSRQIYRTYRYFPWRQWRCFRDQWFHTLMQESRSLTEVFPSSRAHETKSVSLHQTMHMQTVSHRLSDENKGLIPADSKDSASHRSKTYQSNSEPEGVPKVMCTQSPSWSFT